MVISFWMHEMKFSYLKQANEQKHPLLSNPKGAVFHQDNTELQSLAVEVSYLT